ncbi:hypothetical protein LCGC14_2015050 [marine sediment metagenome]|uniref:Uncharacterized protein n=1 Tax=marine sediment metagenome TaxID=412755 RepID=A0A0F9HCK5_9ZZZZ
MWICIPDTLTPGSTAMFAINTSVWPAAIRNDAVVLLAEGGVALEFPPKQMIEQLLGRLYAQRVAKQVTSSPVLLAELAMEAVEISDNVVIQAHGNRTKRFIEYGKIEHASPTEVHEETVG